MAGILNNKERIMDFTITDEGKRQAGQGQMRIKFATFTDYHTFYDVSGSNEFPNLASDASSRVFFCICCFSCTLEKQLKDKVFKSDTPEPVHSTWKVEGKSNVRRKLLPPFELRSRSSSPARVLKNVRNKRRVMFEKEQIFFNGF